jgi:predicted Zn-dependent protease
MLWLLKRIQNHDHLQIPEFLSTHPITDTRIESAKKRLAKNNFSFSQKVEMKNLFDSLK